METKKIKKLVINQETISILNSDEKKYVKGGETYGATSFEVATPCPPKSFIFNECESPLNTKLISICECPTFDFWSCGEETCAK